MWLKATIIINFVLLVISLFSSLFVVYKDKGATDRPLVLLSIRVCLALLLVIQIGFGLALGKIGSAAPWDSFEPAAGSMTAPAKSGSSKDGSDAQKSATDSSRRLAPMSNGN